MGFFFCPRFRRYLRASDSFDGVAAYQLGQIGPSSPTHEHTEGGNEMNSCPSGVDPLNKVGISSSIDEQNQSEHLSSSSGGLSGRIRRRFSRDARDLYRRPKKLDRGPKVPFLHFSSKHAIAHAATVASYDLGSSLMSERGYDSDAQYIATPRHPIHTTEHPGSKPRNGKVMSPRRPPLLLREPDLESSREQTLGLTVNRGGIASEQPPCHGEGAEPQSSWRSRDHGRRNPQTIQESPSFHNMDLGSPRGKPLSPCPSVSRAWAQQRSVPVPMRAPELCRPHTPPTPMRSPMLRGGSFEYSTGQRSGHGHDTGGFVYPSHHGLQQQGYTTSTDSLTGCPPQLSVRKRHQRPRREKTQDEQYIPLGKMNIHRMLASSGSSSHVQSYKHLFDENQSSSNTGTWNPSRHQTFNSQNAMPPIWDAPEAKSSPMHHSSNHDMRPPYSPNSSVSSVGYECDERNYLNLTQASSGNVPSRRPYLPSEHASASTADAEDASAPRSKFTERFSSDRSVGRAGSEPHEGDDGVSTRKLSIGWMSEGRRIGYGYTLVPPDNSQEGQEPMHCRSILPGSRGSIRDSPNGSLGGSVNGHPKRQKSALEANPNQGPSKTSNSNFDISAMLQRLNLPRWANANFALRASNNSDAGSCNSGGSSLLQIFTNKKKNHGETASNFDGDHPWEFCSWAPPAQSLSGQQAPRQNTHEHGEHVEAQLIEKPATLRRREGARATKRKVSEIARNLEKRADRAVARLAASTDQCPVVQRTATRVLRLRVPGCKERLRGMHVRDPTFSGNQLDSLHGAQHSQYRPSERRSSGSSGDWDSLYEECLEEHSIPE